MTVNLKLVETEVTEAGILSSRLQSFIKSVDDLMTRDIPEIRWIVPDLIPEGLTILAGKAKMGKSLLILAMALDIAAGKPVLGASIAEHGRVLFISPDDPAENRLKAGIKALRGDDETPLPIDYAMQWPMITKDDGGISLLREYLDYHKGTVRLIVIDVLGKVMPSMPEDAGAYDRIYRLLSPLKALAQEYHVSIVTVMHKNKSGGSDPLDGIYGNTAYGAVADTILLLDSKNGDRQRMLSTYGKDVTENQFPLDYAPNTGLYTYADGERKEALKEKAKGRELGDIVKERPGITRRELRAILGIGESALDMRIQRAKRDGDICSDHGRNGYYPCSGAPVTPPVPTEYDDPD
jgi:hypothetical protein